MPPFRVKVEVISRRGEADPTSVNELRRLRASGIAGSQTVSQLVSSQLISFNLDCDDIDAAKQQATEMCDLFLVNPDLATAEITVGALET